MATSETKLAKRQGLTFNELLKLTKTATKKTQQNQSKRKNKTLVSQLRAEHKYTASAQLQTPFSGIPHAVHGIFRDKKAEGNTNPYST